MDSKVEHKLEVDCSRVFAVLMTWCS